ncbi:DUF4254 domain-containing protein [Massilia sp. TS11]|uniref:DUF4254 domain-containing protein n=1 Tax=Massilia sp. TS11 TaxID=2908003 RepID=UPI001EDBE7D3|nr:DUF4254 domain-containing protein [Massilia sp. TS11]MCG2586858.1 DUF4254 domain-containing protein [Massilia sp. TS11]
MHTLDVDTLQRLHDQALLAPPAHWPDGPLWAAIARNHACNCQLWDEEDRARRTDVGAAAIAASKRLIDQANQQRNDAVEAIDEAILLAGLPVGAQARLHSETAGAMIDRLSILALKVYHMCEQTARTDVDPGHVARCHDKLLRLKLQRSDLAGCLQRLLAELAAGRAYFKVYRQFKMYNDPTLNPYLSGQRGGAVAGAP